MGKGRSRSAQYEAAGTPIKGYEGEVVPGVRASYSYSVPENSTHARCEIRIKMTESQFRSLGDIRDWMVRALTGIMDNVVPFFDQRGFGSFYIGYRKDSDESVTMVTNRLLEIVKTVEAAIKLLGPELRTENSRPLTAGKGS
jgi:hypothetical protein